MNKILLVLSMSVAFAFIACGGQSEQKSEHQDTHGKETVAAKTYYYTCPMDDHKHIHSDRPGDCPECGMHLVTAVESVPDSAEYFGCPMAEHSHIRHDEAGKCEECNMDLKPMRLVKK